MRRVYKVNVIAYEAKGKELIVNIPPELPLEQGTIWITGKIEDVTKVM